MTRKIFITGTDTDVGKTIVTRGIVRALVNMGKDVIALKPIESGVPIVNGVPVPGDAIALTKAAKYTGDIESICSYTFEAPVSPHLAAKREKRTIAIEPVLTLLKENEKKANIVIAEGAGGLMVPLADNLLYADVIAATDYSLIIVAPNRLGTINATLLTIEAAQNRGIHVLGVILNRTPDSDLQNGEAIVQYGKVPILGYFPDCANDDDVLGITATRTIDLTVFD